MSFRYIDIIKGLINKIESTQIKVMEEVAQLCAKTIKSGNIIYFFGTGHSHMICEEPFYRAGGLVPIYPILEPSLMLHDGAYKSTLVERVEGLSKILLEQSGAAKDDIIFVISNSGRNNATVEMALEAKNKGLKVVAITSLFHSKSVASRHTSRKKLYEVADYVIDNCGIVGDAAVVHENFEQKTGPTSTVADVLIINSIISRAVEIMLDRGLKPPVFMSSNTDEGDEFNKKVLEKYKSRIKLL
ncbi:UPF0309 protein [Thermoanaerobacterium thermosaccharolyticum]|nr:SIS domain-containing protein [Thermoanaerobacterium thermosaccharolyticum]AST56603.1 UPF0309 protein [Thermoanaerobacterium thermosaccharolyticum]